MLKSNWYSKWIFVFFMVITARPVNALTCHELFTKKDSVLSATPKRILSPEELAQISKDYALENRDEILKRLASSLPGEDGRVYIKLVDEPHLTIWAHRWVGVATDIHDHVDSRAAIYVVRGQIVEEFFYPPNPTPTQRVLEEGRAVGMGALPYTHRVFGRDDAISVHAYSPKLDNMSFYEVDPESQQLRMQRRWHGPLADQNSLKTKVVYLKEPLPISSYTQLIGRKKYFSSNGVEVGEAYLFSTIDSNVQDFAKTHAHLKPYRTEVDDQNRALFLRLGFVEKIEPGYGKYFSQVPDAKLFQYLAQTYNREVPEDFQIHMGVYNSNVVSAHQTEMVTKWLQEASVALGDPTFGSVLGAGPQDLAKPVVNGKEKLSTFRHDLEHFGSVVLVVKKVVELNQLAGTFWEKVLRVMHQKEKAGLLPADFRKGPEYRAILDAVYVYNRRFHSLTHVLGMLARENGAININTQHITDFGQSAEIETPTVHWVGLGFRPKWVTKNDLPFENRLFELSLSLSKGEKEVVSIADVYAAVTNGAIAEVIAFSKAHLAAFPQSILGSELALWPQALGIDLSKNLSPQQLIDLQALTLKRHHQMGNQP